MDLRNISTADTFDIWLESDKPFTNIKTEPVFFEKADNGEWLLGQGEASFRAIVKHREDERELEFHLARACAHLAVVAAISANAASILLHVVFFGGELLELGELAVSLAPSVRKNGDPATLKADCVLALENQEYFLIQPYNQDGETEPGFAIVGEHYVLPLKRQKLPNGEILWLEKISRNQKEKTRCLRLARGKLNFHDLGNETNLRSFAASQLDTLTRERGSYLNVWDKYCETACNALFDKARHIGAIPYSAFERLPDGFRFALSADCPDAVQAGNEMNAVAKKPDYLENMELSFQSYFDLQEDAFKKSGERSQRSFLGEVTRAAIRSIELKERSAELPPASGFLVFSIAGDYPQMQRRLKARKAILGGYSANPLLGLIIEENGILPAGTRKAGKEKGLTPLVKAKAFKGRDVTPAQEKAIEIAINTPDIAIIQGPPGTGKTTVIAAIIERLNQLADPSASRGNILVSAYQHDAVENITERVRVNSLPTIKFGRRSGERDNASEKNIAEWRKKLVERLRAAHPEVGLCEKARLFQQAFQAYMAAPLAANEKRLLECMAGLPTNYMPPNLLGRIENLERNASPGAFDAGAMRPYIHALRCDAESWADDGLRNAMRALVNIDSILEEGEKELLLASPDTYNGEDQSFFQEMEKLKTNLLDRIAPEPFFQTPKPKSEIISMVAEIQKAMANAEISGTARIVADFINSLECSPDAAERALEECNVVFAATVQQAEGNEISKAKRRLAGNDTKGRTQVYDTVIIDEAARCNPLDLFIPMTQARKRIILVGDHRQLPHILDDEAVKRMDLGQNESELLKQSIFGYLYERAKKLTLQDGVERVIRLDAQYRMHPSLGELVSSRFYEGQDDGGKVQSPLPATNFAHNLPGTAGKAAIWLNVPRDGDSGEQRAGTSFIREKEARVIVERLKRWLASPESKTSNGEKRGLSFGVISFYKAQADLIRSLAVQEGLYNAEGRLASEYDDESVSERLRVNTVDAFQGMEFDVVILSLTRCSNLERRLLNRDAAKMKGAVYGHLISPNRLCVALSRQRRLLVVAGDKEMIEHHFARSCVPGLTDFLRLCENDGLVLEGQN